jgi:hypothetical protein
VDHVVAGPSVADRTSSDVAETLSVLIAEIDAFLHNPFADRVTIPLMLGASNDAAPLLESLYEHYKSRFADEHLSLFVSKPRKRAEALEINKQIVIYNADTMLTSPRGLRGDVALMYVIDSQFDYYRSTFLDRMMAATLTTARMNGFAGTIHKHG